MYNQVMMEGYINQDDEQFLHESMSLKIVGEYCLSTNGVIITDPVTRMTEASLSSVMKRKGMKKRVTAKYFPGKSKVDNIS